MTAPAETMRDALMTIAAGAQASLESGIGIDRDWIIETAMSAADQAEGAAPQPKLPRLTWAPYQEFGIPDPAEETYEAPVFAFRVGSVGYRGNDIIIYWLREGDA